MNSGVQASNAQPSASAPWPRPLGMRKFVLMSFFTMGLYDVYWFYWNWRRQRERADPSVHAGLLAFLSPFAAYLLLRDVHDDPRSGATWNAALLALTYFLLIIAFVASGWWWLLTWISFLPLVPVQHSINRIHIAARSQEPADERLSAGNIAAIFFGAMVMALILYLSTVIDSAMLQDLQNQLTSSVQ